MALIVGCVAGAFVVRYAARAIPNRTADSIVSTVAGDVDVDQKPLSNFSATGDVHGVAFSADGSGLFVGDREGLTLRDATSGTVRKTFDTDENGVRALVVSPSGALVAAALAYVGDVRVYPSDGTAEAIPAAMTLRDGGDQEQQSVAFSPDGNALAGGGYDKTLRIWRAESAASAVTNGKVFDTTVGTGNSGKILRQSVKMGDSISAVTFSPDGKTVAVAAGPKVTLITAADGKPGATFFADKQAVSALAFSPDGKTIAAGAVNGTVLLFELATGRKAATIKPVAGGDEHHAGLAMDLSGAGQSIAALVYTRDGKRLLAAMKSGTVQIDDGTNFAAVKLLVDPQNDRPAESLSLSPDGTRIAVGYSDGSIRIWKQ